MKSAADAAAGHQIHQSQLPGHKSVKVLGGLDRTLHSLSEGRCVLSILQQLGNGRRQLSRRKEIHQEPVVPMANRLRRQAFAIKLIHSESA